MNPLFRIDFSISDSLKIVRKSVLIYETIIVLKINPYQIYQLREIPVFQQAVEDLHINSTRHEPPHGSLGQA